MDQDYARTSGASVTTLGRKAWTAYIGLTLIGLLLFFVVLPMAWHVSWITGLITLTLVAAYVAYRVLWLKSYHLYFDDIGVWVFSGVLPWQQGIRGVKWRDLDEAVFYPTIWSWLFKSYSLRIGHRFTKASEILLSDIGRGDLAVTSINTRHQDMVRQNLLN